MLKAVVFDMDGVILDSERLSHEAWRELAKERNLPDIEGLYCAAMGKSVDEISVLFEEALGFNGYPEFREQVLAWNKAHSPGGIVPLRRGAGELLRFLKENGVLIGLASATEYDILKRELTDTGVLSLFDTVMAGDMVAHCKPDPELFLRACEGLGVDPAETYGVEDGYGGIQAIHAAGMRAILAEDQYHPTPEIAALCEAVLPTMEAVKEYFGRKMQGEI